VVESVFNRAVILGCCQESFVVLVNACLSTLSGEDTTVKAFHVEVNITSNLVSIDSDRLPSGRLWNWLRLRLRLWFWVNSDDRVFNIPAHVANSALAILASGSTL
jgi:hypothetical protein